MIALDKGHTPDAALWDVAVYVTWGILVQLLSNCMCVTEHGVVAGGGTSGGCSGV